MRLYPRRATIDYRHDGAGQLWSATSSVSGQSSGYSYNPNGNRGIAVERVRSADRIFVLIA